MNDLPREPQLPEDIDDFYRRVSALDPGRPGEHVRGLVLAHAEGLAAVRARVRQKRRRWQPAVFGTLAAAVLAGLVIAPHWLRLRSPAGTAAPPNSSAAERSQYAREAPAEPLPPAEPAPVASAPTAPPPAAPASAPRVSAAPPASAGPPASAADAVASAAPKTSAARAAAPPALSAQIVPQETLQQAADRGELAALRRLLGANADIDARDSQGRTALMHAVLHGQERAVELLLAAGASPVVADTDGTTPLQAAEAAGERAIVEALQRYGARE